MVKLKSSPVAESAPPIAYSYIRFSSKKQADGDSLRRQTKAAKAYCRRKGWTLDTTLTLHDLGVSAFRGNNALVGNLGVFLDAVKRGTVPPGSALICESVDRISRQGIDEGYDLIKRLLKAGIRLVTLSPEREFGLEAVKSLTRGALELQLILARAAEESERKSERCGEAWGEKKRAARENGVKMTSNCPRWLELRDGEFRKIPERVKVVKRIFELAANGYGLVSIAKKLTAEGIPSFGGRRATWTRSYLGLILADRRVLGEHQPKTAEEVRLPDGKIVTRYVPDGPVIPNYYPAAVTEAEWLAARGGRQQRTKKRGRIGKHVNLFAGLLNCATDGGPYYLTTWKSSGKPVRQLLNFRHTEGLAPAKSFPYDSFEKEVLKRFKEIDSAEVLGEDDGPDEAAVLEGELAQVDAELAAATAFMEANGFSAIIGKRIKELEVKRRDVAGRLTDARQRKACPASAAWGEAMTLADALATAPDKADARLRLRAALRRVVSEAWMVVANRGQTRFAAVQFHFAGGGRRDYLIVHEPAVAPRGKHLRPARSDSTSPEELFTGEEGELDLRNPEHAAEVATRLAADDSPKAAETAPRAKPRRRRAGA